MTIVIAHARIIKNWQVEFCPIYYAIYTEAITENEAQYRTQDRIYKKYY